MPRHIIIVLFDLFTCFFWVGSVGFGGGPAFIPLLEAAIVDEKKWMTSEQFLDSLALATATPGLLATKIATDCGLRAAGMTGAFVSAIAIGKFFFLCSSILLSKLKLFARSPSLSFLP
jgi:chromate transporter